jgi:hypothetical protein
MNYGGIEKNKPANGTNKTVSGKILSQHRVNAIRLSDLKLSLSLWERVGVRETR